MQEAKNAACERLIAERVNQKLKAGSSSSGAIGGRLAEVMSRIHVAQPMGEGRETFIPEAARKLSKYDKSDPGRRVLARDVEEQNGGPGVFSVDLRADYLLENPEWKYDKVPEVLDGKNVSDYIDPEIDARLAELEAEEEKLEQEGYYDSDEEETGDEDRQTLRDASLIREKQSLIRNESRMKRRLKGKPVIPRPKGKKKASQLDDALDILGMDTTTFMPKVKEDADRRGRRPTRSRAATEDPDAMQVDPTPRERIRSMSRMPMVNRREDGVQTAAGRTKAERIAKLNQKMRNRDARQGEGDRHTTASLSKHLVSLSLAVSRMMADMQGSLLANVALARREVVERSWLVGCFLDCSRILGNMLPYSLR